MSYPQMPRPDAQPQAGAEDDLGPALQIMEYDLGQIREHIAAAERQEDQARASVADWGKRLARERSRAASLEAAISRLKAGGA